MALEGTVQVPGAGRVPKKYAVGGVLIVGTLIGVYYYRKHKSASASTTAAASATSTNQYPPDGTVGNPQDPYSTDPATGQTYGNEAAGSGGTYGAFGGLGSGGGSGGSGGGNSSGGPPFADNASWSNWVIQQMQANNPSIDVTGLTDAVGLYISGQPLTQAQAQFVYDAIAIGGDPPVAGPNNYPPKVMITNSGGGGTPAHNPVTGLKVTDQGFTSDDISWAASPNAASYTVRSDKGVVEMTGTTSARIRDIAPQHSQATVSVLANPAAAGALPAKIVVKTK